MIGNIRINKMVEQERHLHFTLRVLRTRQIVLFGKCIGSRVADVDNENILPMTDSFSDEAKA